MAVKSLKASKMSLCSLKLLAVKGSNSKYFSYYGVSLLTLVTVKFLTLKQIISLEHDESQEFFTFHPEQELIYQDLGLKTTLWDMQRVFLYAMPKCLMDH
jgi:hypothetical protein